MGTGIGAFLGAGTTGLLGVCISLPLVLPASLLLSISISEQIGISSVMSGNGGNGRLCAE